MKATPEGYNELMAEPLRNPSVARVIFKNLQGKVIVRSLASVGQAAEWCDQELVNDTETVIDNTATVEGNRWVLDGGLTLLHKGDKVNGYVGQSVEGSAGGFGIRFTPRKISSLTVAFDVVNNMTPYQIRITVMNGSSVEYSYMSTNDFNEPIFTLDIPSSTNEVDNVNIIFIGRIPGIRPRISYVTANGQMVFENEHLSKVSTKHDVDPISRRLPEETASFSIIDFEGAFAQDNPNSILPLFTDGEPFVVQYGILDNDNNYMFLQGDEYLLEGKPERKSNIVSFNGASLITKYSDNEEIYEDLPHADKSVTWTEISFKTLAQRILSSMNVSNYELGSVFDNETDYVTPFYVPRISKANALQLVAHTLGCRLYTTDGNVVAIKPYTEVYKNQTDIPVLDFTTIKQNTLAYSKTDLLSYNTICRYVAERGKDEKITIQAQPVSTTGESQIDIDFGDDVFVHPYSDFNTIATRSCFTVLIDGEPLYSSTGQVSKVDRVKTYSDLHSLHIVGNFTNSTIDIEVTARALKWQLKQKRRQLVESVGGSDNEEETNLITTQKHLNMLWDITVPYMKLHNTYDFDYRGNPEIETGDLVYIQTDYSDKLKCLVLTNEINFSGSLSGKMKVKVLGE